MCPSPARRSGARFVIHHSIVFFFLWVCVPQSSQEIRGSFRYSSFHCFFVCVCAPVQPGHQGLVSLFIIPLFHCFIVHHSIVSFVCAPVQPGHQWLVWDFPRPDPAVAAHHPLEAEGTEFLLTQLKHRAQRSCSTHPLSPTTHPSPPLCRRKCSHGFRPIASG